jgi:hypothetical protein
MRTKERSLVGKGAYAPGNNSKSVGPFLEAPFRSNSQATPRPVSAHLGHRWGIAMDKLARGFVFVLLLAAVGLGAGCGGSAERFNTDQFWEKMTREAQ